MMKTQKERLAAMQRDIKPLDMNGLSGRMLRLKSKNKPDREILLVYGHHSSLERMYGIAEAFTDFGNVTMPDLPGFGAMDSFYKIGMKPTLDNLADYLASFIKLRYKGKKISILGMSLGFVVATRMLQRYPDLVNKIEILMSLAGFTHNGDFKIGKYQKIGYLLVARTFKRRVPSMFYNNVILHPAMIRLAYAKTPNGRVKFSALSEEKKNEAMDFEVHLWRSEDTRTYWSTGVQMLELDNCTQQVDIDVHHLSIESDQYFDKHVVEQHMRIIFKDYHEHTSDMENHSPSILATKAEAAPLIPDSVRKLLTN